MNTNRRKKNRGFTDKTIRENDMNLIKTLAASTALAGGAATAPVPAADAAI